jgi:hypothetical protein
MPERPLLILPSPVKPEERGKKIGGGGPPRLPSRERQAIRLIPKFEVLQQVLAARRVRLQVEAAGIVPEEVIILETVGQVENFIVAVRGIEGLEWLGEMEEENIPPDDDFFVPDKDGAARMDKPIRGRLFMVLTNQQALGKILSLWNRWKSNQPLPWGLSKWGDLFAQLRDLRPWDVRDRLFETGILADWQDRVKHGAEVVPCEIELWFRNTPNRRQNASIRVGQLVVELGGEVLHEAKIDEIAYHAMLVRLPVEAVQTLNAEAEHDAALVQCEQIQFFRACGQMAGVVVEDERQEDPGPVPVPPAELGTPVVALFDGLPLQNHRRLLGHLIVDDPDGYEADYPANERCHGTAMASLIIHGDINAGEAPLARPLLVRPILSPDHRAWFSPRPESVSEQTLVVDLLHRCVKRLFDGEGDEPPVAPQVCVINLSIGIRDRLFEGAMSPLARLLDWLAWKYSILFIVSAGNHSHDIEISVPPAQLGTLTPADFQNQVILALAMDARHRRLLSPAEAVNIITVGAIHQDASAGELPPNTIQPFVDEGLPSVINAQGMGYRRTIKPDVLFSGGRVALRERIGQYANATFEVMKQSRPPGQRVAAPGPNPGDLEYSWHTRGTSNATALTSRAAAELYDILEELVDEPGGELIDLIPRAIWLKALIVHSANWSDAGRILDQILRTPQNSRQFKEYVTRLLGYGSIEPSRVQECTQQRVTALSGGHLQSDQAYIHRFPLPPGLSGQRGWRRLVITLAWLTPINSSHQAWRRADLWFSPPTDPLQVERNQADWRAVQRGTVQHEILEGKRAAVFVDGDNLEIRVSCRADAGTLEEAIPYAMATTLEVAEEIGVDIYNEVRVRVHAARIQVAPNP